ncbi:MAG: hypothetical protein AAFP88_01330 [Bacteroidota bacterium]
MKQLIIYPKFIRLTNVFAFIICIGLTACDTSTRNCFSFPSNSDEDDTKEENDIPINEDVNQLPGLKELVIEVKELAEKAVKCINEKSSHSILSGVSILVDAAKGASRGQGVKEQKDEEIDNLADIGGMIEDTFDKNFTDTFHETLNFLVTGEDADSRLIDFILKYEYELQSPSYVEEIKKEYELLAKNTSWVLSMQEVKQVHDKYNEAISNPKGEKIDLEEGKKALEQLIILLEAILTEHFE